MTAQRTILSAALILALSTTTAFATEGNASVEAKGGGFWSNIGISARMDNKDIKNDTADDKRQDYKNIRSFDPGVFGTVTAASDTSITVQAGDKGTVYTVATANASIRKTGDKDATSSDIKVGDSVFVQGEINGTSITAKSIVDAKFPKPLVARADLSGMVGTVTAVSGNTITIEGKNGITYTIDADDATVRTEDEADAEVSDIAVGDNIIVKGSINDKSIDASAIISLDPDAVHSKRDLKAEVRAGFFQRIGLFFKGIFAKR